MQLGGIDSDHSSHSHQVTQCMHEHTHYHKTGASAAAGVSSQAAQLQMAETQQDAQFSLSAWLQKTLTGGRKLWQGIWGSNETAGTAQAGDKSGTAQTMAQLADDNAAATAQALSTANMEKQAVNPYFQPVEQKANLHGALAPIQKLRGKIREAASQLADHLPGRFFGSQMKSPFQAKQQRPREDLRKRSKYRKDELEIDCILTDESYLMDSYDRKGEYTQLTTKK